MARDESYEQCLSVLLFQLIVHCYCLYFFMVILGVFIGLIVEAWRHR